MVSGNCWRSSIITITLALILGDASGLEEVALGIPVILLGAKYSREFEAQADQYAFEQLVKLKIDPIHFANIMQRIDKAQSSLAQQQKLTETSDHKNDRTGTENSQRREAETFFAYLASHPEIRDRIEAAKLASQNMHREISSD